MHKAFEIMQDKAVQKFAHAGFTCSRFVAGRDNQVKGLEGLGFGFRSRSRLAGGRDCRSRLPRLTFLMHPALSYSLTAWETILHVVQCMLYHTITRLR